jgi:hypothetical protein
MGLLNDRHGGIEHTLSGNRVVGVGIGKSGPRVSVLGRYLPLRTETGRFTVIWFASGTVTQR